MTHVVVIIALAAWMALAPPKQQAAVAEIRGWLSDTNANPISAVTYTNASGAYLVAAYATGQMTNLPSITDAARLQADYGVELVPTGDPAGVLAQRGLDQQ